MPVSWTIAGQTGRNFDATARSLESASISSARLEFKNLEPDTLTFTISASPSGAIFPDLVQEMTLYRNGVQFFVGYVTDIRTMIDSLNQSVQVTVSGTWWWLDKVPLTATWNDGAGTSGERIAIVFGSATAGQNLKTSLENVINRAAAAGVPIASIAQGSSVDDMFNFPKITLNQSTYGQALSELVRIVPDTMVWFDYSTKPVRMRITRRGNATATNLDASSSPIVSIDINPVIELQVSQVTLPYVDRDIQGRTIFKSQSSGTNYLSQRQVITVSGPELDTFLPNDLFDSQTLTVAPNLTNLVHDSDPRCVAAADAAGIARLPISIAYNRQAYWAYSNSEALYYTFGGAILKDSGNNTLSGYNILTSAPPANWSTINWKQCNLTATMWAKHRYQTGSKIFPVPTYWAEAGFTEVIYALESKANDSHIAKWFAKTIIISCNATNQISSPTTIYKPADYSFIYPPADLSANLLAAQNWLPYEGQIQLEQEDVGGNRYRGTKVNIANSLSSFSNMGALVKGESLEIETGRTTISLGAPARNDYRTLVDKVRRTSQDNIVYV
jgi:hypothetical protein